MPNRLIQEYSGIVLNQNQKPTNGSDILAVNDDAWRYQEFFLPTDYVRGANASEQIVPPFTGTQIFASIDADDLVIEWKVEYQLFGSGWLTLVSGTTTRTHAIGPKVWVDLLADEPVDIGTDLLDARFRLGFRTSSANVGGVWFSTPNPLAAQFASARQTDGVTAIQSGGEDVSFLFRVLALVADDGIDFLGNRYRSAVRTTSGSNASSINGDENAIWLSKPNPSRFAVESLYFDMRPYAPTTYTGTEPDPQAVKDEGVVVDSVLVDPITPNVYFNVYYSSEGDPGVSEGDWEWKLWHRVPQTFKATKRETHVLPEPIRAKYIKIEFSHLQADHYAPGALSKPTKYKKHPKWVLDYFLARLEAKQAVEDRLLAGRVAVIYDAIDLAYNYYLDDIAQAPDEPYEKSAAYRVAQDFLNQRGDLSDQVDSAMLDKINLSLSPYRSHVSTFANAETLLGQQAIAGSQGFGDYPVERVSASTDNSDLRELRNTAVAFEHDYPVMFFYLTCRHRYREAVAPFEHDRAYFVGIRELSFQRERYATSFDTNQYIEPAGDLLNIERNDFAMVDGRMVT